LLIPPFGDVSNYPIGPLSFDNLSFNIFLVSLFSVSTNLLLNLMTLHTNEVQLTDKLTSSEHRFIMQYNRDGALLLYCRSLFFFLNGSTAPYGPWPLFGLLIYLQSVGLLG
jgi:hypothetical protein